MYLNGKPHASQGFMMVCLNFPANSNSRRFRFPPKKSRQCRFPPVIFPPVHFPARQFPANSKSRQAKSRQAKSRQANSRQCKFPPGIFPPIQIPAKILYQFWKIHIFVNFCATKKLKTVLKSIFQILSMYNHLTTVKSFWNRCYVFVLCVILDSSLVANFQKFLFLLIFCLEKR